eukprot:XP_001706601.1 Hypothetical protein GL50803_29309 [Giardia lamblia ATCC 50803]
MCFEITIMQPITETGRDRHHSVLVAMNYLSSLLHRVVYEDHHLPVWRIHSCLTDTRAIYFEKKIRCCFFARNCHKLLECCNARRRYEEVTLILITREEGSKLIRNEPGLHANSLCLENDGFLKLKTPVSNGVKDLVSELVELIGKNAKQRNEVWLPWGNVLPLG